MNWLILFSTIACNIAANVFLKMSTLQAAQFPADAPAEPWRDLNLIIGIACSGLTLILYVMTLKRFELSVAYPTVTSIALVGVFASSALLFGEPLHLKKLLGAALIIAGVLLLSMSADAARS